MLSLDLFNSKFERSLTEGAVGSMTEQDQEPDQSSDPVASNINQFNTPENRALVKKIWSQIQLHAIEDTAGWLTLEWPGQPAATLSRNQVWTVVNKIAKMPNTQRNAFALSTLGNRNAFLTWMNGLKIIPRPAPKKDIPKGQQSLDLKERDQKKSSEEPRFKSTRLDRLKTQARARYPAAASDMEALAADFVDQQDQDQEEFQRVKGVNQRQDELLRQITALNQAQDREIDNLESDEQRLQQNIQQLQAANAELAKKLSAMTARRSDAKKDQSVTAPAPTINVSAPAGPGVSVATDKAPTTTAPVDLRARKYAQALRKQLNQLQTMVALKAPEDQAQLRQDIDALKAQLAKLQQREPIATATQATVGGQTADVLPSTGGDKAGVADKDQEANDVIDLTGIEDVLAQFRQPAKKSAKKKTKKQQPEFELTSEVHDIPFGMTENEVKSIPAKMVVQGYTVEYNPIRRMVTVSRRGQVVGRAQNKPGSYNNYQVVVNRIIDASEEDKYPDDLEARSVERPFGESQEELTAQDVLFRTAAKAMYDAGQQGVDIGYEDAVRIASKLMRIPYAPSMLPALHAQLQDVEKKIATLKSVRKAKKQREQEKITHQTTADEQRRAEEWMKNYGQSLQRRLQTPRTESDEKKQSNDAYQAGGRAAYYGRANANPYKSGTKEHADYNRGYQDFKDEGKDYLRELEVDRSGQPMYQAQDVYMLTHNGREIAFYKLKDLKRAEQDAREMQRKLGGEVHLRKVMRETEQQPGDDILKSLFKDFGEIFGKQPQPDKPEEPEKKEVNEMGRAGYNPLTSEKHWHEVERYLSKMINEPGLDPETRKEFRQRYLEKRKEAQQKGWAK